MYQCQTKLLVVKTYFLKKKTYQKFQFQSEICLPKFPALLILYVGCIFQAGSELTFRSKYDNKLEDNLEALTLSSPKSNVVIHDKYYEYKDKCK